MKMKVSMKVIAVALAPVGLAVCGLGDQVSLVAVTEVRPGLLAFAASCSDEISVEVEETSEEVHITDVVGNAIDGDCLGGVTVELEAPLGRRDVVVGDERWIQLSQDCSWGSIGPPNLGDRVQGCGPRLLG